jgi:ABC-2 type transport system permease protein
VRNLIGRQLERNRVFLVAAALVLAAFEFIGCAIVASVDIAGAMSQMMQFAPPVLRAMIEQNMPGGSPTAVLAFAWNHPVAHALLTAVAITLPARAIAGETETGVIEILLAQPISRAQYFAAHLNFGVAAIAFVLGAGLLGTAIGQQVYSVQGFGAGRLAALFLNMFLLQLAIYGFTLAVSAYGQEAGRVAIAGVLVAVVSFLVNAIAMLWNKAQFAKPYSLHGYYEPRDILTQGQLPATSIAILSAFAIIAIVVAYRQFARRDLP